MPEQKAKVPSDSSFDEAARLAVKAMDHAHRHRSPPQPRAYEVWYTYVPGDDPVLRAPAHGDLGPDGAQRIGGQRLTAHQGSARGGERDCEVKGDRVLITGRAVTYLEGIIEV